MARTRVWESEHGWVEAWHEGQAGLAGRSARGQASLQLAVLQQQLELGRVEGLALTGG